MTKLIKTFLIGSCGVHGPPYALGRLGFFPYTIGHLGFKCAPFALTSGAAVQVYDFCVGDRKLSQLVRKLAYMTQNEPVPEKRHLVDDSELAFIELSSPVEPMIGDDIVNFNYISEFVVKPLRIAGAKPKLLSGWVQSLINVRDDLKERADALLADWPEAWPDDDERRLSLKPLPSSPFPVPSPDDPELRFAVETLRTRRLDVDDMVRDLEVLREKMRKPLAIRLYDFRYMPDGRPIDWPAGFKTQQIEIARRMNLATLDFAPVVERYGPRNIFKDDPTCAHFLPKMHPLVAELMYDFWADILGRPYLETYPEWLEAKHGLFEGVPKLFEGPARLAFPNLKWFPSGQTAGRAA
jgi:hypothetical protein